MKTRIVVTLSLALIALSSLHAGASRVAEHCYKPVSNLEHAAWNFGQGITSILFAPYEVYASMINSATEGAYKGSCATGLSGYLSGATAGYLAGMVTGFASMLNQVNTGLKQAVTFWKPQVTQPHLAAPKVPDQFIGPDDCFDPDPFWFNGPVPPFGSQSILH
jgi:hypothetical protein